MERDSRDDRDQACNECRRRKARCDKTLPECGPCKKNRRHCLYERHSRTPLTRKYLTQVEEQLRRAQLQASRAEAHAQHIEARLRQLEGERRAPNEANTTDHDTEHDRSHDPDADADATSVDEPPLPLEGPPSGPADFSWDEQTQDTGHSESHAPTNGSPGEEEGAVDGMASLTVDDNEAGYLGVASGAAMLRLLLPDAHTSYKKPLSQLPTAAPTVASEHWLDTPLWDALNLDAVNLDAAINAYFGLYHNSYPLVEEHTFRAQYSQVIPRPSGRSWHALAFMIAAVGHFTAATGPSDIDRRLFMAAKSNVSIESLEMGNVTLVQTLTLMSNYLQKRNKPNSGYNYLGLALHMAMGLGLHKEFHYTDYEPGTPLNMEIRRRVWWCIFVFSIGASITFGRPLAWPNRNVEASLPLNVSDRALTNLSRALPSEAEHVTTFSSVIMQSKFHLLTNDIYTRVISMPFPSATELVRLDDRLIGRWESSVPSWYHQDAQIPPQFATGHAIMWWRLRNFKIIMYRPYVMRRVLQARAQGDANDHVVPPAVQEAYQRCLREAKASISAISKFWTSTAPTRLSAWYALYFLFQAALIPCVCLRNEPNSSLSASWRSQISETLHTMQLLLPVNPSAQECYNVIQRLCGPFLQPQAQDQAIGSTPDSSFATYPQQESTQESPQTQINNVYAMMWPNANPADVDVLMQDGLWTNFFPDLEGTTVQTVDGQEDGSVGQFPWD